MIYDELISIYEKEYNQAFKRKDAKTKTGGKNMILRILVLPKWVKVTKKRFDEIQSIATEPKNNN